MLRPELPGLLELARTLGLKTTLLTSGMLIDRAWARLFARLGVRVKLSLDGARAATHDWLRGAGNFERVLAAMELLRGAECEDRCVHFTVHRRNAAELDELPALLLEHDIRNLVIGVLKPSGRAKHDRELLIDPGMMLFIRRKIARIGAVRGINLLQFKGKSCEGFGCPAVCDKFGITANGRSTTCAFFGEEDPGGSIREHSLAELWEMNLGSAVRFVPNAHCAACPALETTGGGCRARALYWTGDLNGPDPECCARNCRDWAALSQALNVR
jgi:radical SAM protein with 4Fe4S-binding SPASM domain